MPLPPARARRERKHVRRITYEAFKRADGLWDIEAHLTDVKDHDYALSTGVRPAGEPVHDMWIRVTIDYDFVVRAAAAHTDAMPYPGACDAITPEYARLEGTNLMRGFRQQIGDLVGGVRGCAHLTEMLAGLPTAAVQAFAGEIADNADFGHRPFHLDRCHALESSSETVRRYYAKWHRPAGAADADPAAAALSSTQGDK